MVLFVQAASNSGVNVSAVTVTLGAGTTGTNGLVTAASGSDSTTNPHVTGITLGGAADHFGALVSPIGTAGGTAAIIDLWADPNCAGGQTSVVVTWSGTGSHEEQAFVYEFSGLLNTNAAASLLDKSSTNFTTTTNATFTSNATATTTQASELWFGAAGGFQTAITGPSSPWVNSSQLGSTSTRSLMAGYQIVSSTGTATYSGSYSPNSFSEAGVVALFAAAATAVSGTVQPLATFPTPRRRPARAVTGFVPVVTVNAASGPAGTVQPLAASLIAPRRRPARAVVQFIPVTTTNAPLPPPKLQGGVPSYDEARDYKRWLLWEV